MGCASVYMNTGGFQLCYWSRHGNAGCINKLNKKRSRCPDGKQGIELKDKLRY